MRVRITMFAIASLFLVALAGYAQQTLGTISGTITDSSGAVLPGAKVELLNAETGISRSVVTNNVGFYNAPALPLGNYKVTATQTGFEAEARNGIELTIGRNAVVNFQLKVGSVATTVEVTGEAPLVETTKGGLGSLVESKTVTDLPLNGRDLAQLITLQTGAVEYTGAGSADLGSGKLLVISGARPTTNVFLMDGVSIESYTSKTPTGTSGQFLGAEAVREFRVESNAYSAEYGRGAGGIFNVATKSGTNTLHGSVFEYLRNDKLDANKWEANRSNLDKPAFRRNQFGFSLGGPIKKDRTFFFGTYEGYRERLGQTATSLTFSDGLRAGLVPNPAAPGGVTQVAVASSVTQYLQSPLWPKPNGTIHSDGTADFNFASSQPTDEDLLQMRIDHKISDKDNLFGRYTHLRSDQTLVTGAFPYEFSVNAVHNHNLTLEEDRILSPSLLNTFRFGFSRNFPSDAAVENPPISSSLYFVPTVPQMGAISISNGPSGVGNGVPGERRIVNSFQWADDVNLTRGRHTIKFGVNINRIQFNGYNPARDAAQYAFASVQDFLLGNANGQFRGSISVGHNDAFRSFRDTITGLYYQDDIRLTQRLTLNAGLRYEFISTPSENYGRVGTFHGDATFIRSTDISGITIGNPWIENPSRKNFAPRLGFAWDVFGNGKTAIRGGFGLFFQQIDSSWYRTSGFRTPPILVELQVAALKATPLGTGATLSAPTSTTAAKIPFPNIFTLCGTQDPFSPTNPCAIKPTPDVMANHLRTPYVAQYNLNIQREILRDTVATVGFAGSRGIDLAGVADVNNWDPQSVNGQLVFPASVVNAGVRPNLNFDQIRLRHTGYDSWYNSLQVTVSHKYSQGLQLTGGYTFSKNIDTISGIQTASDTAAGSDTIPIYGSAALYKGLSAFDARHVFTFNSTYELPFGPGKHFASGAKGPETWVIEGWQLGGIVTLASGFPMTVNMSNRFAALGVSEEYPDRAAGYTGNPTSGTFQGCTWFPASSVPSGTKLGTADLYFDPCAFSFPAANTLGNSGRNTLSLPGRADVDFSLLRNFKVTERANLQFRFEAFNLFNRVNLGIPTRSEFNTSGVVGSTVGRITSTVGSARQMQFALRLTF